MSFDTINCVVTMDRSARCWGEREPHYDVWTFDVPEMQGAVRVVAGNGPLRGLYPDGRVACHTAPQAHPQLDCDSARDRFARLGARVVQLESARGQTCAVTEDQRVFCRGLDCRGSHCGASSKLAVRQLALAGARSCALTADDDVLCWGAWGQADLMIGTMESPERIAGLPPIVTLGGGGHACAVARDGAVYCWGERSLAAASAQRVRSENPELRVQRIERVPPLCELAGGRYHMCGVAANGAVYCWGANHYGQLGAGDRVDRLDHAVRTLPAGSVDWSR